MQLLFEKLRSTSPAFFYSLSRALLQCHRPALSIAETPIVSMYRTAAARTLRAATQASLLRQTPIIRQTPFLQSKIAAFAVPSIRCYSAPAGLGNDEVKGRIMDLLKNFDKVHLH